MALSRRTIIQSAGVQQGAASTLNATGSLTASVAGGVATLNATGGGAGSTVSGQAVVDFGAFPGSSDASVAVAAAGVASGSIVTVSLAAVATADHSADEHWLDGPTVLPGAPTAGVGFTIYAAAPKPQITPDGLRARAWPNSDAGNSRLYGKWTVNWSYT